MVKEAKTAGGCGEKTGAEKMLCNSKLMVLLKVVSGKQKVSDFLFNPDNDDFFANRRLLISCLSRNLVQSGDNMANGEISDASIRDEIQRKCLPLKTVTLTGKLAVGTQIHFEDASDGGLYLFFLDKNNGNTAAEDNTTNRAFACVSPSGGSLAGDLQITNAVWWRGKDTNELFVDILGQVFNIMLIAENDDNSLTFFTELNMDALQSKNSESTATDSNTAGGTQDFEASSPLGFSVITLSPIPSGNTEELLAAWESHCTDLFAQQ